MRKILYTTHKIPNGGFTRAIFISPKSRNEADLKKLAEELRQYTKNDRNAFIFIFDDEKAAKMQQRAFDLTEEEGAYFDKHQIATYTRNINTGLHEFQIMLGGNTGQIKTIEY